MTELNGVPLPDSSSTQPPPGPFGDTVPGSPPQPYQPAYGAPQASYGNQYPYPGQPTAAPGATMGIVGFVLAFVCAPAGIIVSAIALSKSKKAQRNNGLALAGLILSSVFTVLGGIILATFIWLGIAAVHACEAATTSGSGFTCSSGSNI